MRSPTKKERDRYLLQSAIECVHRDELVWVKVISILGTVLIPIGLLAVALYHAL